MGAAGESVVGGAAALASAGANIGSAAGASGDKSVMDKVSKAAIKGTSTFFNKAFGTQLDFQQNPGQQTIGAPGTYIETPKFYQYSNTDTGLQISFSLSNTLNDDGKELNHKFIKDFTRMNRPYRTGPIGMTFPAIYNVVLPGQRYIQWAFLESFNIGMLGMRRRIPLPGGGSRVVPEGYSCQFNFRSLTMEAANFMDEIDKYGSFTGDANSYAALKVKEEKTMEAEREAMNTAAQERSKALARNRRQPVDPERVITSWRDMKIDPRSGKPVGQVDIHGSGYGSVYHRNKYPEQYGENKPDYYDLAAGLSDKNRPVGGVLNNLLGPNNNPPAQPGSLPENMSQEKYDALKSYLESLSKE